MSDKKAESYWNENSSKVRKIKSYPKPELSDEAKAHKERAAEITRISNKFLMMNKNEITIYLQSEEATMLEVMIGSAVVKIAKTGDFAKMDAFLEKMKG